MSMNIEFGTRTCKCDRIRQTPTKVTQEILTSPSPMEKYFEWLRGCFTEKNSLEDLDSYEEDLLTEIQDIRDFAARHKNARWYMV